MNDNIGDGEIEDANDDDDVECASAEVILIIDSRFRQV